MGLAPTDAELGANRELLHAAEIMIKPIKSFLEPRGVRKPVAGLQQYLALVRRRCAQQTEEWLLTGFEGNNEIVSPIDHENRHLDVRCKVDGIGFRQCLTGFATTVCEDRGVETRFESQGHRALHSAPAVTVEGQTLVIDIGAGLEVVQ